MKKLYSCLAAAAASGLLALTAIVGASAHDVSTFGKVTVALGLLHEPAYVGFDNAVQVLVKDDKGSAITSITDKDLTVEVSLNAQKMAAQPLLPTADPDTGLGIPGEYQLHFIPTAPGAYTFHLKGTVAGQAIDETKTASDKTFNLVQGDDQVEFPNKVPAASDLNAKLTQLSSRVDSTRSAADSASQSANRGTIFGGIAIAVAVILGGTALLMARRKPAV